jgi:MFS family permease
MQPLLKGQIVGSILLPFAFGYYLSYLLRVINAVLAPDLSQELGLGPQALGLLTASYFIAFASTQIPLGILLDRWGPRRVEAILLLFAALGALLFSLGESTWDLMVARAIIGFGVSACLMAAFKAFTLWFPPEQLPRFNGIIMAAGGVGALSATAPVQFALTLTDWRGIFAGLAILLLLCAVVVFVLVPESHHDQPKENLREQIRGLTQVLQHRFFWSVAPVTMLSQGSFISIQSLWASPWLQDVSGMSRNDTADLLFLVAASMVASFLIMGNLTVRLSRQGVKPIWVAATGMALFMLIEALLITEAFSRYTHILWMAFGFFGTTGIVLYAVLSQFFPRSLSGRVNTLLNLLVFITTFSLQYGMGAIIEHWVKPEIPWLSFSAYHAAFGFVLLLQIISLIWLLQQLLLRQKKF